MTASDPLAARRILMGRSQLRPPAASRAFLTVSRLALGASPRKGLFALLTMLRGKRQRGWNLLNATAADHPDQYARWISVAEPCLIDAWCGEDDAGPHPGLLPVIVDDPSGDTRPLAATLESLRQALGASVPAYTNLAGTLECRSIDSGTTLADALGQLPREGWDWMLPLQAGDRVSPQLGRVVRGLRPVETGDALIYWDEDRWADGQRTNPRVKPDWDPVLFARRDFLTGCVLLPRDAVLAAANRLGASRLDIEGMSSLSALLATSPGTPDPVHIPLILSHRSKPTHALPMHPHPEKGPWPRVSIIIPTRDHADLLEACLAGLQRLAYPGETEWIIVDNGSTQPDALELLNSCTSDRRVRVLRSPGPFNFSALNNRAVQEASGSYICLLNNDVEPTDGVWLTHMVRQAMVPETGAVGALLFYPDMTVQHAGVAIGIGGAAGHVQRGLPAQALDDDIWSGVTRSVSAVTAACMVVSRAKYLGVGGLDEEAFSVAFNDVDFCLKLGAAGWRNVQIAEARLIHHESKSRGKDMAPENVARFEGELSRLRCRWNTASAIDPYFSPLFSPSSEKCLLLF